MEGTCQQRSEKRQRREKQEREEESKPREARGPAQSTTAGRASATDANTLGASRGPVTAAGQLNVPVCRSPGAGAAWDAGLWRLKPERYQTHPTEGGEKAGGET